MVSRSSVSGSLTGARNSKTQASAQARAAGHQSFSAWGQIALLAGTVATLLTTDAVLHAPSRLDLWAIHRVQELDVPGLHAAVAAVSTLTSSTGAVLMWAIAMVLFAVTRRWLPALALFSLPLGGVINEGIGALLVGRVRPDSGAVMRTIGETDAASFPSGHVMGAVMFYGFLMFLGSRLPQAWLRRTAYVAGGALLGAVGFARIWEGAHWPTDVLAAYAFGGLFLAVLFIVYNRIEAAVGDLPFIRAGAVEHDETVAHAHALTSVVLFDRERGEVRKIYNPGFLPRAIYWLAFQAPFPYVANRAALDAAVERRNLVGLLTEYWYGSSRVARAVGVESHGERLALVSTYVDGTQPTNRAAARSFLNDLRARFEEAGLPTWQIDPRQPRAVDNVLETADGYMIVDLESGLVAPLASRRAWARGVRRGEVPMFDTVFFDITRAYISRETERMTALHGAAWVAQLTATLDAAEATANRWHASEPRLWSVALNPRSWRSRMQRQSAQGQAKALDALQTATTRWEQQGRISRVEAGDLRAELESPQFQAVLPHLGAHVGISVVLRFPFGSIARAGWSAAALLGASARLLVRRSSLREWRLAFSLHNPLVIALAAIPGFGTFAYLASGPVRGNRLLIRITLDALLHKVPANLYRRSGAERVITAGRPVGRYTGRDGRNGRDSGRSGSGGRRIFRHQGPVRHAKPVPVHVGVVSHSMHAVLHEERDAA